jgi:hypothetical protein
MNDQHSYTSLHAQSQRAKRQLARVFEEQPIESSVLPPIQRIVAAKENQTIGRWKARVEAPRRHQVVRERSKNGAPLKGTASARGDMSAFSFALTLLLSGTIAGANTDHAPFWLLIGPAPLALGLMVAIFLKPRFDLPTCLAALRKRDG